MTDLPRTLSQAELARAKLAEVARRSKGTTKHYADRAAIRLDRALQASWNALQEANRKLNREAAE